MPQTHKATFTIHIAPSGGPPPIVFSPDGGPLPDGAVGTPVSETITQVTGGVPPITFAVTNGSLPPGTQLDANLNLTGTPTSAGDFSFEITATDSSV
jgi:large repetitive protein